MKKIDWPNVGFGFGAVLLGLYAYSIILTVYVMKSEPSQFSVATPPFLYMLCVLLFFVGSLGLGWGITTLIKAFKAKS